MNVSRVSEASITFEVKQAKPSIPVAFAEMSVDVLLHGTNVGLISVITVNRQVIPSNGFFMAFDEHSSIMEWVGCTLMENRYGRTTLQSLRGHDDPEYDFMLVDCFDIKIDHCDALDVKTKVLHKFLRSEHVVGHDDYDWDVSYMAYVLPLYEHVHGFQSPSPENQKFASDSALDHYIQEAIPFVPNGFFFDMALLLKGPDNARILVGSQDTVCAPPSLAKAESDSRDIATTICSSDSNSVSNPKDVPLLNRVIQVVDASHNASMEQVMMQVSSIVGTQKKVEPPRDMTTDAELKCLKEDIEKLVLSGSSIARSTALHHASSKNSIAVARLLLTMDPTAVNVPGKFGRTPLMEAALNASGRVSIDGIRESTIVDLLLASGANKDDVDVTGLTAYGHFKKQADCLIGATKVEFRHTVTNVEHKLYPPGGPTKTDFSKGKGGTSGFADYDLEDQEMGYAPDEDDY